MKKVSGPKTGEMKKVSGPKTGEIKKPNGGPKPGE